MLKYQAEMIKQEAQAKGVRCLVRDGSEGVYIVELGERGRRWLSYWYAVMDLWELEYKKEGINI